MNKQGKLIAPLLCAILPLIPLSYLYVRNADYISAVHVSVLGAAMVALSLLGYFLLRLIFKSRLSALLGCVVAWVLFFALKSSCLWIVEGLKLLSYGNFLISYGVSTILLMLAVSFVVRKASAEKLFPVLLVFFGLLLVYNMVLAVRMGIAAEREVGSVDLSKFKTRFSVSQEAPSPNIYWFHCDGMLGFDSFEKYFGDDQAEFTQALSERGFQINRSAMLEANHKTMVAVPALMCPDYYDHTMYELIRNHQSLSKSELQSARLKNETRLAFERKGYLSQTIGTVNIYYPPVSDRFYVVGDTGSVYTLETEGDFEKAYLSIIQAGELTSLLVNIPGNTYFNTVVELGNRGLLGFPLWRGKLSHVLPDEWLEALYQGKKLSMKNRMILEAVNDSTFAGQPTFNMVFYVGAHFPFTVDENGEPHNGDPENIYAYAPQHRYAAAILIGMIDQILSRDPDAVIVLQADHGLHGQSEAQITAAFGKDAVLPIWNQVMSALRVPEKYKDGEESFALSNPLNMSRYLVNTFVGENYAYVE